MENIILSVKTSKMYRVASILVTVISFYLGFELLSDIDHVAYESRKYLTFLAGCEFGLGISGIINVITTCSGYLNMYKDHIEGKGFQKRNRMCEFILHKNQIHSIEKRGSNLCIYSTKGNFKIICSEKNKQAAIRLYEENYKKTDFLTHHFKI